MRKWVVVENAGYEGEYVWPQLHASYMDAERFAARKYRAGEREELHVDIAYVEDEQHLSYDY